MKDQELFTPSYEDRFHSKYRLNSHLLGKDCISQLAHEFSIEIGHCFSLTMGWVRAILFICLRELKIIGLAAFEFACFEVLFQA